MLVFVLFLWRSDSILEGFDSQGILGRFDDGAMLARNGTTIIEDANDFGQEWQVLGSEPMLFTEREGPQHPQNSTLPSATETYTAIQRRFCYCRP